ncbi:MAG: hypothetical protein ACHQ4H_12125, partial [Ktedonobacterales bacterium]
MARQATRAPALVAFGGGARASSPDGEARRCHVAFALQLTAVVPGGAKERLASQALLQTRLASATLGVGGTRRAIELRYTARPGTAASAWRDDVACHLLARVSGWAADRVQVRAQAMAFAVDLRDLLASTLPHYRFVAVTDVQTARAALHPFDIRDTVELRHRVFAPTAAGETSLPLPLPLLGVPDADAVIELMLRQPEQTAMSFCFEPLPLDDEPPPPQTSAAASREPEVIVGALRREALYG